jgi:hypothetical protein
VWQKVGVTNFLYVGIYKRSDRAALGPFLPTLVFISTIIEVPHASKRVSHVYAVIEQDHTYRKFLGFVYFRTQVA